MRRLILLFALAGVLAPGASLAQQSDDLLVSTARDWGGEGGAYTCEQWRAYMARLYRLADPKKRGYIDEKSFAIIPRTSSVFASATFDYFDQAGKGRVTREEFLEFQSPFFARFDKKHSCRVTNDELRAATGPAPQKEEKPQQIGGHHGFGGGAGAGGLGGGAGGGFGGMGR
ncbi:EF-hand domain-containing protein [Methylocystis bryophila]|uniref:EF-hand domain-containing protein n=1 Tax=Methylocystis bryophila TaxID=655015 RepID=A0A1W6N1R4_9HYPH|nr:EF-hand domain-containing protein [Methylocystis bryophila]ARN83759.1 hypothetical protein B1812_17610 [Methylocystis bryophila]BDV38817.1 hypothetical protein DSM21852_20700 [Methylocystis bryophila]